MPVTTGLILITLVDLFHLLAMFVQVILGDYRFYNGTDKLHGEIEKMNEKLTLTDSSRLTIDNITEASAWTLPQLQSFLDGFNIETQHEGASLDKEVLLAKLVRFKDNALESGDCKPSPFGKNCINFWKSFALETIIGFGIVALVFYAVASVHYAIHHYTYTCNPVFPFLVTPSDEWFQWLPCYVIKKADWFLNFYLATYYYQRQGLGELNIVYSALIGSALAVSNARSRLGLPNFFQPLKGPMAFWIPFIMYMILF